MKFIKSEQIERFEKLFAGKTPQQRLELVNGIGGRKQRSVAQSVHDTMSRQEKIDVLFVEKIAMDTKLATYLTDKDKKEQMEIITGRDGVERLVPKTDIKSKSLVVE